MKSLIRACRMKFLMAGLFVGVFTTANAIGGMYSDAININLSLEGDTVNSDVSGSIETPYWVAATWYNYRLSNTEISGNNYGPDIASRSPTTTLTANGVSIGNVGIQFYADNMYSYGFPTGSSGNGTVNTLPYAGFFNSPSGTENHHITIGAASGGNNIPVAFQTAGYDIALLNDGNTWTLYNNGGAHYTAADVQITQYNGHWAAIQILKLTPQVPVMSVLGTNTVEITNHSPAAVSSGTDFGSMFTNSIAVTNTFVVTNSGGGVLYLTDANLAVLTGDTSYFFVITNGMSTNIAASGSTSFTISFNPSALGTWTGIVSIANSDTNSDPFLLSVRGAAVARVPEIGVRGINFASISNGDVTPDPNDGTDFATVNVTDRFRDRTFTVTNSGSGVMYLSGLPTVAVSGHTNEFSVIVQPAQTNVAAGSSGTFTVRFDPTNAGLREASISIVNSDTNANPYVFNIQGNGTDVVEPLMKVKGINLETITNNSPASIAAGTDFGDVYTNASLSHVFSITNEGTGPLYLTNSAIIEITGDTACFSVNTNGMVTNIAADASTTFAISFNPNSIGEKNGVISIANSDTNSNAYVFGIHGTGLLVVSPAIAVIGTNLVDAITNGSAASVAAGTDFGNVVTNLTLAHVFSITNSGDGPLYLNGSTAVAVGGVNSNEFTVTVPPASTNVVAGSNVTFTVQFQPASIGLRQASISIANSDTTVNPHTFAVSGTGVFPPPLPRQSIGITFGNGSQNGNGSGPGMVQDNWNNINCSGWDGGGWPYGTTGNGYGPANSDGGVTIATIDSTGATLGSAMNFRWYDAGQAAAMENNGAYGGGGNCGTGQNTAAYNAQYTLFQTSANSPPADQNCTITFGPIPYPVYDVWFGGANVYANSTVWESGTPVDVGNAGSPTGAIHVSYLTNSSFSLVAQWGHPYDGLGGKLSYIQFVPSPPEVNNEPGVLLSANGMYAGLRGTLVTAGAAEAYVWVYWGTGDGSTNKSSWATNAYMGSSTSLSPVLFTNSVGPLGLQTEYFYRYYATNAYGDAWAPATTNFMSQGGTTILIR